MDGDVIHRIQRQVVIDQQGVGGGVVVLHRDVATVDLDSVAQRWLIQHIHRSYPYRTRTAFGMAATLTTDHDLAEPVGQGLDLGDVDIQRVAGHAQRRCSNFNRLAGGGGSQGQHAGSDNRFIATGKVDFIRLDIQITGSAQVSSQ